MGEKAFTFAVRATILYASAKRKWQFVVADQFFRSATSIGANIREASATVSRKDFANKMAIASKEARESLY
ncbi:MAG: four helix bundle protein [Flavobacteriales bacterium]|nr:four helix bundle protein [Flavobacteriales bacterium]